MDRGWGPASFFATWLLQLEREDLLRVDHPSVALEAEVEVRTGREARLADLRDHLAAADVLAALHQDPRAVHVVREHPVRMFDDHAAARAAAPVGEEHAAALRGHDRLAGRQRDVDAGVLA